MRSVIIAGLALIIATTAHAAEFGAHSSSFGEGEPIPAAYAFCTADGAGKAKDAANVSPQLRWFGAPQGTKSYAILAIDHDVPASFDNANQEGKTIAKDAPRQDFYHWVLLDIPASVTSFGEGMISQGKPEGGKPVGKTAFGTTHANDYSSFMKGTFGGYDGPCPPWNDARLHHYHFHIHALDVEALEVPKDASNTDIRALVKKHTLAETKTIGTYTTNKALLEK